MKSNSIFLSLAIISSIFAFLQPSVSLAVSGGGCSNHKLILPTFDKKSSGQSCISVRPNSVLVADAYVDFAKNPNRKRWTKCIARLNVYYKKDGEVHIAANTRAQDCLSFARAGGLSMHIYNKNENVANSFRSGVEKWTVLDIYGTYNGSYRQWLHIGSPHLRY